MCDRCEAAAKVVADTTDGALDAEDVRRIVRAFNEAADTIEAVEQAQEIASAIESGEIDVQAMAAEQEADPGSIPGFIMEALVAGIGGPVVVLGARPMDTETGEAMLTIQCAGTGGPVLAAKMAASAAETLSSPIIETGGVGPDGSIVSPMRRRSTRDGE
jgi:hypothetical protein